MVHKSASGNVAGTAEEKPDVDLEYGDVAGLRGLKADFREPSIDTWSPPDFGNSLRTRIGASVVDEFVAGHQPSDVLRELVQNEFDGGGNKLTVQFSADALDVAGNGRGISTDGWKRLSVIVGTGRVVGDDADGQISRKANGIGSKNFGLRSLFLFGDQIYVRSNGQVALLDLPQLLTGRTKDIGHGGRGVRLKVPFRTSKFEKLEPFRVDTERRTFDAMAGGVLATLIKLALTGRRTGLRELTLSSTRLGRSIKWRQKPETVRCRMRGVSVVRRIGQLKVVQKNGPDTTRKFEELEFTRILEIPAKFSDNSYPDYYRRRNGRIYLGVSLPIARKKIDLSQTGNFYYPLQTPDSRTGCTASVSAPFDLDADRSSLIESEWNRWLQEQAAKFTIDLIREDWFSRFGAAAFKAVVCESSGSPSRYAEALGVLLAKEKCWPVLSAKGPEKYAVASELVSPDFPELEGFLSNERYLALSLQADEIVRTLARKSGVKPFTVASLVRLRCAGEDADGLSTKVGNSEANFHFVNHVTALSQVVTQERMAEALTKLWRHISKPSRVDLEASPSTLTASGKLKPANQLVLVDDTIWDACPEPLENRLHPNLIHHQAIARLCRKFDEQSWILDAAQRAIDGDIDPVEREALYAKLLSGNIVLARKILPTLKASPVLKNHRGEWVVPSEIVSLKGGLAKLFSPTVNMPSKELSRHSKLLKRLGARKNINGEDVLNFAHSLGIRPADAERFEAFLADNMALLRPSLVSSLSDLCFLRSRSGKLEAPISLHLDTTKNRRILNDDSRIVAGTRKELYRKLGVLEAPSPETLIGILSSQRALGKAPPEADLFYSALASAWLRNRKSFKLPVDEPILWVGDRYHSPEDILVGNNIPSILDEALPVFRSGPALERAYVDLGARNAPSEDHWIIFLTSIHEMYGQKERVTARHRRQLMAAYNIRGAAGLPEQLGDDICCLLDCRGRLFSRAHVKESTFVEADFPQLAKVLIEADSDLGIADPSDYSRDFLGSMSVQLLSVVAGAGKLSFGDRSQPPIWFHAKQHASLLTGIHRPLFIRAIYELTGRQQHGFEATLPAYEEFQRRMHDIDEIGVYETIHRAYRVGRQLVKIQAECGVLKGTIGLVRPKTKFDCQQLLAQSLAELVGAVNAAQMRVFASLILPLLLSRESEDIYVYLQRMGIDLQQDSATLDCDAPPSDDTNDDLREEIILHVMDGVGADDSDETNRFVDDQEMTTSSPSKPKSSDPKVSSSSSLVLPDIENVSLMVSEAGIGGQPSDTCRGPRSGGKRSIWTPPTAEDVERDRSVGRRGEELVYQMELERVRALGYSNPEDLVVWTSEYNPGADHDIKSVDQDGHVLWIEVKSTTGTDGQFEWSRREFEKALKVGRYYQLWRVYNAASTSPSAKCYKNPAALVAASKIVIELSNFRCRVENAS
ncbi:DUF3883 domain-containing protein [Kordiimonas aestuarii]|uniref:DUF3883 domain-containing protein n=1 Tax=Kordiimonas aestuarii TaxID=1005925 RepID=UPI0021CF0F43|nr:DUF3883 domain-containing protein [Kordiimonas aestuarii]